MSNQVLKQVLMTKTSALSRLFDAAKKLRGVTVPKKVWMPAVGAAAGGAALGVGAAGRSGGRAAQKSEDAPAMDAMRGEVADAKAGPQTGADWLEFAKQHPVVSGTAGAAAPLAAYGLYKLLGDGDEDED